MPRRYARYRPAARWRPRRRLRYQTPFLRTVGLNRVGYSVLALACLLAAAVGYLLGGVAEAVVGAAVPPVALVVVDRVHARRRR